MKTAMKTAMMTSIFEVMETMFFLPAEPGESGCLSQLEDDTPATAKLSFSGEASGELILAVPGDLLREMAENFMGEPQESLSVEHLDGTLTEMVNMVCGNALRGIETSRPFDLGIPEQIEQSSIADNEIFTFVQTPSSDLAFCVKLEHE